MEIINRVFMPILPTKTYAISESSKYSFATYIFVLYNPIQYMFVCHLLEFIRVFTYV